VVGQGQWLMGLKGGGQGQWLVNLKGGRARTVAGEPKGR